MNKSIEQSQYIPTFEEALGLLNLAEINYNNAVAEYLSDCELASIIGRRHPEKDYGVSIETVPDNSGNSRFRVTMQKRGLFSSSQEDSELDESLEAILSSLRSDEKVKMAKVALEEAKRIVQLSIQDSADDGRINNFITNQFFTKINNNIEIQDSHSNNFDKEYLNEIRNDDVITLTFKDSLNNFSLTGGNSGLLEDGENMTMHELNDLHGRLLLSGLLPFSLVDELMEELYNKRAGIEAFPLEYHETHQGEAGHPDNLAA